MTVELAFFIQQLVETYPEGLSQRRTADDHIRLVKKTLRNLLVGNVAVLRVLPVPESGTVCRVLCHTTPEVGGGGWFMFDADRIAEDDNGGCVAGWVRQIVSIATPQMFGAIGDGVADDTDAVQAAIDFAAKAVSGTKTVEFPTGTYLISSPINMTRGALPSGAASRGDICLRGQGKNFSAILLGQTGKTKPIIDVSCTTNFRIKDLALKAGDANPSGIGILALGGQLSGTGFCGNSRVEGVYILLKEDMTANAGLGTVGLYLGSCEEAHWTDVHVQANLPLFMTANMTSTYCPGWTTKLLSDFVTTDDNFSCGVNLFDRPSFIGLGRERPIVFAQGANVLELQNYYFARAGSTSGSASTTTMFAGGIVNLVMNGGDETGCLPLFDNKGTVSNARVSIRVSSGSQLFSGNPDDPLFMSNAQQSNYGGAWLNSDLRISLAPEIARAVRLFACNAGTVSAEPKPAMLRNTVVSVSKALSAYPQLRPDKSMLIKSHDSELRFDDVTLKTEGRRQVCSLSNVPLFRAASSITLVAVIATIELADFSLATNANAASLTFSVEGAVSSGAFSFRSSGGQFFASTAAVNAAQVLAITNSGSAPRFSSEGLIPFVAAFSSPVTNALPASLAMTDAGLYMMPVNRRYNSAPYAFGSYIFTVTESGKVLRHVCTTAGTTAASSPSFASVEGGTTTDGTATWLCVVGQWSAGKAYVAGDMVAVLINGLPYFMKCNIGGTSGSTEPVWSLSTFDFVDGGTLRWLHGGPMSSDWHVLLLASATFGSITALMDFQFSGRIAVDVCGCRESFPVLYPAWVFAPDTLQNAI